MNIVKKIRTFFSLEMKSLLLLIEAFIYLGWARILKSMPFSKVASTLGIHMDETPLSYNQANRMLLTNISEAIHIMSRHTFWESKCLVRAIAGLKMLERRQIESTLYLGTAKDETGKMIAHAWLRSGPFYITGAEEMKRFTIVGKFAKSLCQKNLEGDTMYNDNGLDLKHVPKELKLQFEIIRMANNEELKAIDKEWFAIIDWDKFLELAMHHRVFSLLYQKMKEMDEKLIPAYVIQTLHRNYKMNTFQMLHLSAEMQQISKWFTENEIRPLYLKGPVLAADLYGDISLRTSRDLDILIPLCDLDRAEGLLLKLGYVKEDNILTVLNDWKWRHHHKTYFHSRKQITLEIHWRLNPGPSMEPQFEELWGRKRRSFLTSYPVYYLGREDMFLFLVSHGARHGWSRLRWLADIHQIVRQKLDWEKLNILLKKYHYLHVGGQALILASQLLKTPMIEEMKPLISGNRPRSLAQDAIFYLEEMVNLHTDPVPDEVSRYHKRHLFSLMSSQQKFFFIMSFLYPYPEDVEALSLPKHLHFLYFPLRPVLWAWRKTRKHVLS